jgi:uncharacterized coiled-coil protein SlyX
LRPSVAFQESFITQLAGPQFLKYVSLHATADMFLLLSSKAFQDVIESIMVSIGRHAIMVNYYNGQLKVLVTRVASDDEDDIAQAKEEWTEVEGLLQKMEEMISILNEFHTGVTK